MMEKTIIPMCWFVSARVPISRFRYSFSSIFSIENTESSAFVTRLYTKYVHITNAVPIERSSMSRCTA